MKGKLCGPQEPIALLGLPPSPAPHCQMQFLSLPWMPKVGQDSSYRHLSKSKEGSDYEENQPLPLPLFHSGCRYHSPKSLKKYIKIIPKVSSWRGNYWIVQKTFLSLWNLYCTVVLKHLAYNWMHLLCDWLLSVSSHSKLSCISLNFSLCLFYSHQNDTIFLILW